MTDSLVLRTKTASWMQRIVPIAYARTSARRTTIQFVAVTARLTATNVSLTWRRVGPSPKSRFDTGEDATTVNWQTIIFYSLYDWKWCLSWLFQWNFTVNPFENKFCRHVINCSESVSDDRSWRNTDFRRRWVDYLNKEPNMFLLIKWRLNMQVLKPQNHLSKEKCLNYIVCVFLHHEYIYVSHYVLT